MQRMTVEAVLGGTLDVDLCNNCQAFWFEPYETLHLTPASTLRMFHMIAQAPSRGGRLFPARCHCPKCGARLNPAHDMQRNTPFEYLRCTHGHGRFTSFSDFLKEKNFVKPLTPQEIAEISRRVRFIHCSGCGASVDLANMTKCEHCGAALSMLDFGKMGDLATQLQRENPIPVTPAKNQPPIPQFIMSEDPGTEFEPLTLIEHSLRAIAKWLRDLVE
jgi:hypothetical protein